MTSNVAVDEAAQRRFDLAHLVDRIGAAERKPVGLSQPELTGLLLPFHSDDVIISYDFVVIFFSSLNFKTCNKKLFYSLSVFRFP